MPGAIQRIQGGSVTTPRGFSAGATAAGIKTHGEEKLDLGLLYSAQTCTWAGTFTTNKVKSPSVVYDQNIAADAALRGVVVTAGIANACVGAQGLTDAKEMADLAADHMAVGRGSVLVGSTGVIGVELPMALIRASIPAIGLSDDGGQDLAKSIMTTDTHHKYTAVQFDVGGTTASIGGIAKGVGMIHPNMATMLCFLSTDASVPQPLLQETLRNAVNDSLNMLSVDGDTSTNDMAVILANGASGAPAISEGSPEAETFQAALSQLCVDLTKQLAADGEGATHLIEVQVDGAANVEDARAAAKTVVSSSLVKSAVHGADPNWGRILAALGRSGADVSEEKVALYINDVCIMEGGVPIPFHKEAVVSLMRRAQVTFRIGLGLGAASATAWGCDLTEAYVVINSAYTT
jgi:glutamate N-acetyltransferase/amino-acid N-acetyltransferase